MRSFRFAFFQMLPIAFSYVFLGIGAGLLLNKAGYAPIWAFISAVFIYAGSMQIVMVSLMTSGASFLMIALMTLLINARHIFYGLAFIDDFKAIGKGKFSFVKYSYAILTLSDEVYSLLASLTYPQGVNKSKVQLYILGLAQAFWIFGCTTGALVGQYLPFNFKGIDFSIMAFFTAIIVSQWQQFNSHIPAITGLVSAVLFYFLIGPDNFILPALALSMVVLIVLKDHVMIQMRGVKHG